MNLDCGFGHLNMAVHGLSLEAGSFIIPDSALSSGYLCFKEHTKQLSAQDSFLANATPCQFCAMH